MCALETDPKTLSKIYQFSHSCCVSDVNIKDAHIIRNSVKVKGFLDQSSVLSPAQTKQHQSPNGESLERKEILDVLDTSQCAIWETADTWVGSNAWVYIMLYKKTGLFNLNTGFM